MDTITVKTQAEWDALPDQFAAYTQIKIESSADVWLTLKAVPKNAFVVARDSSHVVAWDSSHVEARGSSHVVARGSSHVVARGSSHVVAWDSSHVEAWDSSHVEAWGSSHVEARGSSHVVARGSSALHHRSSVSPEIHGQAACFVFSGAAAPIASGGATIINVNSPKDNTEWLDANGVLAVAASVVLYKRVSVDFKTQEGEPWETTWVIGEIKEHTEWSPLKSECGAGKFHACPRPYFCDEFRSIAGDRYIALSVAITDLHAWPNAQYPHKISFRKAVVLHECDRYGKEIK